MIVGDGPERKKIETLIKDENLSDNVKILGFRTDVLELLGKADIFIFPSEIEGLSNAVIEAAYIGIPIVACDIPGVNDIIDNGKSGILINTRNPEMMSEAIYRSLNGGEFTKMMKIEANKIVRERYSISNAIEKLYAIYHE